MEWNRTWMISFYTNYEPKYYASAFVKDKSRITLNSYAQLPLAFWQRDNPPKIEYIFIHKSTWVIWALLLENLRRRRELSRTDAILIIELECSVTCWESDALRTLFWKNRNQLRICYITELSRNDVIEVRVVTWESAIFGVSRNEAIELWVSSLNN